MSYFKSYVPVPHVSTEYNLTKSFLISERLYVVVLPSAFEFDENLLFSRIDRQTFN